MADICVQCPNVQCSPVLLELYVALPQARLVSVQAADLCMESPPCYIAV